MEPSDASTITTRDLALASFWMSRGLTLIAASAVENMNQCVMTFHDPEHRERELTIEFSHRPDLHAFVKARRDLAAALGIAKDSPDRRCSKERLAAVLAEREARRASWRQRTD